MQPNPVVEGQDVTVDYQGDGPLYVSVDGGTWQEVAVDPATGKATVTAPPGSTVLSFSDMKPSSPNEMSVEVLSAGI